MAADLCPLPQWRCEQERPLPVVGDGGAAGKMLPEVYAVVETHSPAAGFAFAGEGVDEEYGRDSVATYGKAGRSPGFSPGVYSGGVSALFFIALH